MNTATTNKPSNRFTPGQLQKLKELGVNDPYSLPEYRWNDHQLAGKLKPFSKRWPKLSKDEQGQIEASVNAAYPRWFERNVGMGRSAHGRGKHSELFALSLAPHRDLRTKWIFRKIVEAASRNDQKFFIRLGEALKRPAKTAADMAPDYTLEGFLMTNWAQNKCVGDAEPLCMFGPELLAQFCRLVTGTKITTNGVDKVVKRLGLLRCQRKRLLFTKTEQSSNGGLIIY